MSAGGDSSKVVIAAMLGNATIAVSKFVAGILTGSASTIAEAVHSVADTLNQILLLFGLRRAKKKPSELHQFGHASESYFWPFLVSVMIFLLGGVFALYEGGHALLTGARHTDADASTLWNYGVLGVAVLLELYSFSVAFREFRKQKGSASTIDVIVKSKDPTIPVVLMEDTAALIGLVIAIVGVALSDLTGWPGWDAAGSILIGVLLCSVSYLLARETHSLLIGESATADDRRRIVAIAERDESVVRVGQVLTMHRGPEDVLLALKIAFRRDLGVAEVEAGIDRIEDAIRKELPRMVHIFVEPDAHYEVERDADLAGVAAPLRAPAQE
ncbi:MAG: cation diffusion facilitator family transporter [Sandaracinaceae bacterium]|nr:cation diffusion facilitator family transporter [Sandaracinaceae bacterium]